jgi:hypothetical protein
MDGERTGRLAISVGVERGAAMSQNTARTRVEPLDLARDPLAEEGRGAAGHKRPRGGRGEGLHARYKSKHH